MLSKVKTAIRALFQRNAVEHELDSELRFHLECEVENNIKRGMNPAAARREALRSFGAVESVKEQSRDTRGIRLFEAARQDLHYGARVLVKNPGFTIIALFTLALGIGANTAIFSVVNTVMLRPLPFQNPGRLVLIRENLPKLNWYAVQATPADFIDFERDNKVFSAMAGFESANFNLTGQGAAQRLDITRVSASLFSLLGVNPALGRGFLPEEDQVGRSKVAILTHGLWQREFGADPNVLGKVVRLNDRPYTVVGVMPAGFQFPPQGTPYAEQGQVFIPLALTDQEKQNRANSFDLGVIARLKDGVSLPHAQADIDAIVTRIQAEHPEIYENNVTVTASVVLLEPFVTQKVRPALLVLLGAVGLVLLIACANVANLMLARTAARRREMAVRNALGASFGRLIRQLLTESILLAVVGGGLGLLLAFGAIRLISQFGPADVPRLQQVGIDPFVVAFTLLITCLAGVLSGLAPAIQGSRLNLNEALKQTGNRSSGGREGRRVRSLLIIAETATAVVLLIGAGLLVNSFVRLLRVSPGFNPDGVVVARTALAGDRYPRESMTKSAQRQSVDRLAALPGVQAAAIASNLPLVGERNIGFVTEDKPTAVNTANNNIVSEAYFRAMGIPVLKGRTFTEQDMAGAPAAIVVNQAMARRFWPGESALGKRLQWGGWPNTWLTVVGIVADVKVLTLDAESSPEIYMPLFQLPRPWYNVTYIVRTAGDPTSLATPLRRELAAVDPDVPVFDLRTMNQVVAASVSQRRFIMSMIGLFASVALVLAAIGLYGVISYSVTQRTQEIGIRIALGAQSRDVARLVLGQGMILVLTGLAIGLVGAFVVTRFISGLLFGVTPTDPATYIGIALLLISVALLAAYLPARRATRTDPIVALRYE